MGRGSTQILIKKILGSLKERPKSATEITKESGLDRSAIIRYLEVLEKAGFITSQKQGTSKRFILSPTQRKDTYFGLPLKKETEKIIDSLYHLIRKQWNEKTGRKLFKTTAQKIIYKVIKDCKIKDIPVGWYIYGGITIKPYEYEQEYDFSGLDDDIIRCIKKAVKKFSANRYEYESRLMQYKDANKPLYETKEKMLALLYSKNFSKNSMFVIQKHFNKLIRYAPRGDDTYEELINYYNALMIDITNSFEQFSDENYPEFKQKLINSFETLWKMIAMYNFKKDMEQFYIKRLLDENFKLDISKVKEELIELCSQIDEMIAKKEPKDKLYKDIKKAVGDMQKTKKQIVKDDEELFRKAGL